MASDRTDILDAVAEHGAVRPQATLQRPWTATGTGEWADDGTRVAGDEPDDELCACGYESGGEG